MRDLLSDGFNSAAHVAIGMATTFMPHGFLLGVAYVIYQIVQGGENMTIDLLEFTIGAQLAGAYK